MNDQQLLLLTILLGTIFFYAYTVWTAPRVAYFLGIVTIAISFGILRVAPSGNVFTVACVALAASVVLWRSSMIYCSALPETLMLAKEKGSSIQWTLSEFIGWGEPIVQTGITLFVLVANTQDLIAKRSITAPLGAIMALIYPRIMDVASHDSQQQATAGHMIRSEHILIQHSIYSHLRHPMYLAAFWLWIAIAITLRSIWVLVFWAGYALAALLIYVRAEEKQLQSVFGDKYESYKRKVPGFIPRKPLALIYLLLFSQSGKNIRCHTS
jgi:protein-S-isoprenylcysteine O-methyltransferase Ste14